MIGRTLFGYIARLFLRWIVGLFLGTLLLIFLIDLLELLRSVSSQDGFDLGTVMVISAFRVPSISEQVLPFAVLLGSMAALLTLSRRSELAVSRAAGLSVWQFTAPGIAVALAIGVIATTAYNPLATTLKAESDRMAASGAAGRMGSLLSDISSETWLRQHTEEGDAVIKVAGIAEEGRVLVQPVIWMFGRDGMLKQRIEASRATLGDGVFQLTDARVHEVSGEPRSAPEMTLPTALTARQISQRLASPSAVSFWRLPDMIAQSANAGLPPARFQLQYDVLLLRPALLAAMVLIATTVSLGMSRKGNAGRMILGGVTAGFMLYVVTEIFGDLGSEGLVPPLLAAAAPAFIALTLGATVLLFQEDG
ncbi:LPS export ABC transporter permease LptG [Methylobrevis pamukkalensis]|uniref:Lipopolysaccharide export system permease protein LptG n=1 Tax=Methylobrevis pamukkalensis TaxID=1439726 RepID=A0A1E3H235_9HYPH|nr:LPS export ABC transporter permease LptG [Methylobrevis pamukkalensis]ODN69601.1 Lipopolysaccharide export system permease protein LptG [Methylobrevis pamukkalensis]